MINLCGGKKRGALHARGLHPLSETGQNATAKRSPNKTLAVLSAALMTHTAPVCVRQSAVTAPAPAGGSGGVAGAPAAAPPPQPNARAVPSAVPITYVELPSAYTEENGSRAVGMAASLVPQHTRFAVVCFCLRSEFVRVSVCCRQGMVENVAQNPPTLLPVGAVRP